MELVKLISILPGIAILIAAIISLMFYFYPVEITSFSSNPEKINLGEPSMISWKVDRASSVEIDQGFGIVTDKGLREVSPSETTVYTIYAKNLFGSRQKSVKVTVTPTTPDITSFYADLESVNRGQSSTLHWSVSDAEIIFIDHELGNVGPEGETKVFPHVTTTYTLTAKNKAGSTSKPVKIEVLTTEAGFESNFSANDWIKKGDALRYLQEYDKSAIAYKNALELDPTNSYAWTNLGRVLYSQKMFDEALLSSENAIKFDQTSELAWNLKGVILADLGRTDEAIQAYDRAIELNSTFEYAWHNKGVALNYQGKYNESIVAFDEVLRLNPNDAEAWSDKGIALMALGLTTEAESAFDKAKELGYKG
jgi:hypothetical protein